MRYRIVGPDETDAAGGYISMDSPLGRALLGKGLDARGDGGAAFRQHHLHDRRGGIPGDYQMTRTFLNCHGSLLSMSSGKRRSRSVSGVQSV